MSELDSSPIPVLAHGDDWVAVNKPSGVIMHPSHYSGVFSATLVQRLSEQLGSKVHVVHRLDGGTSGVVLVALTPGSAARLSAEFASMRCRKHYLAVCRGWCTVGTVEHPLTDARGRSKPAVTELEVLATARFPWPDKRFSEQRYSLLRAQPRQGRQHQIRRHLKHISHPLIGDVRFGKGEHNRWFREHFGLHRPLLHAWQLALDIDGKAHCFIAPLDQDWRRLLNAPGWNDQSALHGLLDAMTSDEHDRVSGSGGASS